MNSDNNSAIPAGEPPDLRHPGNWLQGKSIRVPGLTKNTHQVETLWKNLSKSLSAFFFKRELPCLWVVFAGGTGTGKSTLFNAFCGKSLSETGVERPKTVGPIIYSHKDCPLERSFPFPSIRMERHPAAHPGTAPSAGMRGHAHVLVHEREDLSHLIVVDTPDLDSVEAENRQMAEDLYLLSDAVVFVTSQEKYADDVPHQFLLRVIQDEKRCFFLLNKRQESMTREEVMDVLHELGVSSKMDRVWFIPHLSSRPEEQIAADRAFYDFSRRLLGEFSPEAFDAFRQTQLRQRAGRLKDETGRLSDLLAQENRAAQKWLKDIDALCEATCHGLVKEEKKRFTADSRKHIQREIRNLFSKYDVLAKPRRYVRAFFLTPLRALGLYADRRRSDHRSALSNVRRKIDFMPVLRALEKFNGLVLESLSPSDPSTHLFKALRRPGVVLTEEQIKAHVLREQDHLDAWLEKTFEELSRGLSKEKKWGIYSTSVVWGVLILSFEIAVGGGFTILDAVLDSAIAPFVTKGAVELFAYREIQKTARELAMRYQKGLLSVVNCQREKYEQCLESLVVSTEIMEALRTLESHMKRWESRPLS